jgi:translation initiation factor eIF-2B subunit epsilon
VGPSTTIKNSYIFAGTSIGGNCSVEKSIIGVGVVIKEGSVIPTGCLIGDRVVIGPSATLQEFDRLSAKGSHQDEAEADDDGYDSEIEEVEASKSVYPNFEET